MPEATSLIIDNSIYDFEKPWHTCIPHRPYRKWEIRRNESGDKIHQDNIPINDVAPKEEWQWDI